MTDNPLDSNSSSKNESSALEGLHTELGELSSSSDPLASPVLLQDNSSLKLAVEGKSFGIRAIAYIIDIVIIYGVSFLSGLVGVILLTLVVALLKRGLMPISTPKNSIFDDFLLGLLISITYFGFFEWLYGATPGKAVLGLRVVKEDGKKSGLISVIVRGLFRFIDGLFFCIPAIVSMSQNSLRQRLGDKVAHTLVLSHRDSLIQKKRSIFGFLVAGLFFVVLMTGYGIFVSTQGFIITSAKSSVPAANLNLTVADVGRSFKLKNELGTEAFQNSKLEDANVRAFSSDLANIYSQILIFSIFPNDKIDDLIIAFRKEVTQSAGNQELLFELPQNLAIGERAGIERFTRPSTKEEGFILFFVRGNTIVRISSYGEPNAVSPNMLIELAQKIDARIR